MELVCADDAHPMLFADQETMRGISGYAPAAAMKRPANCTCVFAVAMHIMYPRAPIPEKNMQRIPRCWMRSEYHPAKIVQNAATT